MNKNITKFEKMPKVILGFLINMDNTTYYIVNNHLNEDTKQFILEALSYYQFEEMAKITISDIEKNTNAIQYAKTKGLKLSEQLYKCS